MPISITCPGCSQICQVADEHAGMQVQCPVCKKVLMVPSVPTAVPVAAAVIDGPAPAAPPPYPQSQPRYVPVPGTSPFAMIDAMFPGNALARPLFFAGVGCLGAMLLFTFLPWYHLPEMDVLNLRVGGMRLGIQAPEGILAFLLTGGALGFLAFVIFAKQGSLFDIALWVAGGWSAFASFWRLIDTITYGRYVSFGLILTLLAALGAAGTLGYLSFLRIMKKM